MTYNQCIHFLVSELVPNDLIDSIREQQKNNILHKTLTTCLNKFTNILLTKYLTLIIDNHSEECNIRILQDEFLDIILIEKNLIYNKFIHPEIKDNNNIHQKLYSEIRTKFKKLQYIKNDILKENTKLNNILTETKDLNIRLQNTVDEYYQEIIFLKKKSNELLKITKDLIKKMKIIMKIIMIMIIMIMIIMIIIIMIIIIMIMMIIMIIMI